MKNRKLKKAPITIIFSLMILFCMFTATSKNIYAQSKDINDVKAIQKIITIQRNKGAKVSTNLDNKKQYKWSKKTGRLIEVSWAKKSLKGKINFNRLTGLKDIIITRNKVTEININKLTKLEFLECSNNNLRKLNIQKHKKLEELFCSHNRLKKLKLDKSMQELSYVYCSNNKINKLHVEGLKMLEVLDCDNNGMKKLELKNLGDICIYCENNKLKKLNFSNVAVVMLFCSYNKMEAVNTYNAQVLYCSNNKIKEIKGSFYNMTYLKCDNNQIMELNIDKPCDEFEELYCQNNNITRIDFTGIKSMKKVVCDKKVDLVGLSKKVKVKRK